MVERWKLVLFVVALTAGIPAQAASDCASFLSMNEPARKIRVTIIDMYVAGFRDASDIGCPSSIGQPIPWKTLTDSQGTACLMRDNALKYRNLDEADKLALLERGCRTEPAKETRDFVLSYLVGGK
jgi:hypothetical protein